MSRTTFVLVASTPKILLDGTPAPDDVRQFQVPPPDKSAASLERLRELKNLIEQLADVR
jgi:hypothetical protein